MTSSTTDEFLLGDCPSMLSYVWKMIEEEEEDDDVFDSHDYNFILVARTWIEINRRPNWNGNTTYVLLTYRRSHISSSFSRQNMCSFNHSLIVKEIST